MSDDFDPKRFAWARSKFDVEGIAGAIAAWLVGILLGILWDPLFWIGAIAAVGILLATRRSNRTGPTGDDAIVAPVDGVVVSVTAVDPPSELRYGASEATRIRIASSPASQNRIFAPASGDIRSLIQEQGTESQPIAMDPDAHGLFNGYATISSPLGEIGLRLVTGGLGPRVDFDVQEGDLVETGKVMGKRRLGGWCDVFVPSGMDVVVRSGMTLVAAETRLTLGDVASDTVTPTRDMAETPAPTQTPVPTGDTPAAPSATDTAAAASTVAVAATATTAGAPSTSAEASETPSDTANDDAPKPSQSETDAEDVSQLETLTTDSESDASEMFAALRDRVEGKSKPES